MLRSALQCRTLPTHLPSGLFNNFRGINNYKRGWSKSPVEVWAGIIQVYQQEERVCGVCVCVWCVWCACVWCVRVCGVRCMCGVVWCVRVCEVWCVCACVCVDVCVSAVVMTSRKINTGVWTVGRRFRIITVRTVRNTKEHVDENGVWVGTCVVCLKE